MLLQIECECKKVMEKRRCNRRRKNCCVSTCVNHRNVLREQTHRFPRAKKVAEEWVQALNDPNLNIEEAGIYNLTKSVCHRHFATHQFNTPARLRLNRGAVPTLFLTSSDNSENCPSEPEIQKVVSAVRNGSVDKFAESTVQDEFQTDEVKEETSIGTYEEAGHQLLPHLDSKMHISEYNVIRDLHPSQEVQENAEKKVQEDSVTEHDSSNGNPSDLQNVCRGPVEHVGDTAVDGRELPKMCDTASDHGGAVKYEDIKFVPNESYLVATGTWENLPNEMCRLCASTDEHPRQSIAGWLDMLNEIIPGLVALNDGLPQHMCRPCTNKLYTCNKIKTDFIEANNKIQEYFRFTKSSGIQFLDLQPVASAHQTSNEVAEVQSVSQVVNPFVSKSDVQLVSQVMTDREQLMSGIPSDVIYGAINTSNKDLLKGQEIILNCIDTFSINVEECVISCTDNEATFHGNLTQNKSDPAGNTLNACDTKVEKVEPRNKKYKYVCGECEEMFTVKGALRKHKRTHFRVVFECDYCNKEFTQKNQLNDHRRIHTKELPFMCEICGKCFRTSMNLNSHKYVHKPPSYTCQVCSKKFSSSICLAQHKKVHCTDMQLMCEVCGKMLYTPFSLKIHLRRHTGEKPFRCSACGKCFTAGAKLKKHRLIHADRKF